MAAAEALKIARGIDDKVEGVDHKVGSVMEGELCWPTSDSVLSLFLRCEADRIYHSASGESSQRSKPFVISHCHQPRKF
jgi:hypothetical protein